MLCFNLCYVLDYFHADKGDLVINRKLHGKRQAGVEAIKGSQKINSPIVNHQCVVYLFSCDLCDADYVGYTARHLHQRIAEHKNSAIVKHLLEAHGDKSLLNESLFRILRKWQGKFDCLVYEMLCIEERNPSLNTPSDSIRAKLFV